MLSQQRAKKSLYYVVIRMILRAFLQPKHMFDFDNMQQNGGGANSL